MWERGRSKRKWVEKVQQETKYPKTNSAVHHAKAFSPLRQHEDVSHHDFRLPPNLSGLLRLEWFYIMLLAVSLIFYPFVLATLTSYYTPTVGLSCRSFTFVVYFISQFWLSALWLFDFHNEEHYPFLWTPKIAFFKRHGIRIPTLFASAVWLGLMVAVFTSLVGTFFQIAGVYRNCLCITPLGRWSSGNFRLKISDNSADDIYYARQFWFSTGISAIALLLAACYGGWWYQRHWRARFVKLIDYVLNAKVRDIPKSKVAQSAVQGINPTQGGTQAAAPVANPSSGEPQPEAQAASMDQSQAAPHATPPEKTQPETLVADAVSDDTQPEALAVGQTEQPQSEPVAAQP